jgi:glycosyltransferase involved in cell wall biosynthesis
MKDKKETPKFSIITVVYNDVENIEETIKSVINQTYKNFEYIIIDGNSDDGTVEKIKKYEKKISYWVSEKDKGIYDAMNKGIKKARGELLYFLNSNDFFYNNDVLKNVAEQYLEKGKPDILYGRLYCKYNDSLRKDTISPKINPKKRLPNGSTIYHQSSFIKKKAFEDLGLYEIKYKLAGDYDFFCRCFVAGLEFCYIENIVSIFNRGGRSSNSDLCYEENSQIVYRHFGIRGFARCWLKYKIVLKIEKNLEIFCLKCGLKKTFENIVYTKNRKRILS